ncbi:MAG: flavodoxin [Nocardia sp.]|nr:flavodoxin [Nocardia sp.]
MKTLIVCASVSHGNTMKVAQVIGEVLAARVATPESVAAGELDGYDLIGFGSGVRGMALYPQLTEFVRALPPGQRGRAFAFATSGFPEPPFRPYLSSFARRLDRKGFEVVGTFSCRALDTWLPLRLIGGLHNGRPDAADLAAARAFAETLT